MAAPPIRLGPYALDAMLARGGMGEVWRATHVGSGEPVAVKVVTAHKARSERCRETLRVEVRAASRLDHVGIVRLFDHGEVPEEAARASGGRIVAGSPYIAMELAAGALREVGEEPRACADWAELKDVLQQILAGLAHAHSRGVLHRDLKPGNVLVVPGSRLVLKIADFGLARSVDEMDRTGNTETTAGTPHYMAPEQMAGHWRDYGPWTDLFALGCVAFELSAARATAPVDNLLQLAHARSVGQRLPFEPRIAVPDGFEEWLDRLMATDPADRYQLAADAAYDLSTLGPPRGGSPAGLGHAETRELRPDELQLAVRPGVGVPWVPVHSPPRPQSTPPPADWRAPDPEERRAAPWLAGVGVGAVGLRAVPIVGRVAERDRLWAELMAVTHERRARAVALTGPPGIGKTRLAWWLAHRAHERGVATWLSARCAPDDAGTPALARLLARALVCGRLDSDATRARIARILRQRGVEESWLEDAVGRIVREWTVGESPGHSFGSCRERCRVVARILAALAGERSLVLLLDDVHHAPELQELVETLLEEPTVAPVLLLGTADDGAVPEALAGSAGATMELGPLPDEAMRELAGALVGADRRLVEALVTPSRGNPLVAIELVADFVQRGLVEAGGDGFLVRAEDLPTTTGDLADVWTERVAGVIGDATGEAAKGLAVAALLGMHVLRTDLRAACAGLGVDPGAAEAILGEAALAEPNDDGWSFVHQGVRDGIVAFGEVDVAALHRACAGAVADAPVGPGRARALAHHLHEAGDHAAALDPLLAACREALERSDYGGAESILDRFGEAAEQSGLAPEDPRRGEAQGARLSILAGRGDLEGAAAVGDRAIRDARDRGWRSLEARALLYRGMAAWKLGDATAGELFLSRALEVSTAEGMTLEEARSRSSLGTLARLRGDLDGALAAFAQARALFDGLGDDVGVADVDSETANALLTLGGDEREALQALYRARERYVRLGRQVGIAACRTAEGDLLRRRGDIEGAIEAYREARERYDAAGAAAAMFPQYNLGLALVTMGRFADARAVLEQGLERATDHGRRALQAYFSGALLACLASDGEQGATAALVARLEGLLDRVAVVDRDLAAPLGIAQRIARRAQWNELADRIGALADAQWERLRTR